MSPYTPQRLDLRAATGVQAARVHLPEYCAASGIPSKPTPSAEIGHLVEAKSWTLVSDQVLADVLATAILAMRHLASVGGLKCDRNESAFRYRRWRNAGLSCIILRQANGTLGGYVAVAPSHPLWGFAYDAIPVGLDIMAHCGLDYSESCREYERESIAICHVSERRRSGRSHPGGRQQNTADDTWWFGFGCDKPGDLVPGGYKPPLHREEGEVYRSIDYVYEETRSLARSLKAIEDGPASSAGVPPMLGAPDKDPGKA